VKRLRAGLALLFAFAPAACGPGAPTAEPTRVRLAPGETPAFARALSPRAFRLPEDHGPHPEFQTEWWYYTGNLAAADGRRFGFQLTFFRRGLAPGTGPESALAPHQVYFAHFAVTDVAAERHVFSERWSRAAMGLSGARAAPYRVWLEDWEASGQGEDGRAVRLRAAEGATRLDLTLAARKPLVAHGDRGLSAKSDEPGNASYYVGYTRMAAEGRLEGAGGPAEVRGEAWFDHEWSTSALGPEAVGWDWFSLQLDDGRELMLFQLRRRDGTVEAVSGGTLVEPDGATRRVAASDVAIEVLDTWRSPHTGARYPARWRLTSPAHGLSLEVVPWTEEQEMRTSFTYWEGAVRVGGTSGGAPVTGAGYVELTGYARTMQGVF
jgi:predicted secreted hydrolase